MSEEKKQSAEALIYCEVCDRDQPVIREAGGDVLCAVCKYIFPASTQSSGIDSSTLPPQPEPDLVVTAERSFFAALRALRHLYFKLEKNRLEVHSSCGACDHVRNFLSTPNYFGKDAKNDQDFEAGLSAARAALEHLYRIFQSSSTEFHTTICEGCTEIQKFLTEPDYRGNMNDPVGLDVHRPGNYARIVN